MHTTTRKEHCLPFGRPPLTDQRGGDTALPPLVRDAPAHVSWRAPARLFPRAPCSAPSIPLCDAIPLAGPTTSAQCSKRDQVEEVDPKDHHVPRVFNISMGERDKGESNPVFSVPVASVVRPFAFGEASRPAPKWGTGADSCRKHGTQCCIAGSAFFSETNLKLTLSLRAGADPQLTHARTNMRREEGSATEAAERESLLGGSTERGGLRRVGRRQRWR